MPDRPFDCHECKRSVAVCYTEIVGDTMTRTHMCALCPHLERRLYGIARKEMSAEGTEQEAHLVCGHCDTTLEDVRTGHPLGCMACYDVFTDVIIADLTKTEILSRHLASNKKTAVLHIGRAPGEVTEINPTLRLIALNEALDETLIREDYEQAALLRDQIRVLKEKNKQ